MLIILKHHNDNQTSPTCQMGWGFLNLHSYYKLSLWPERKIIISSCIFFFFYRDFDYIWLVELCICFPPNIWLYLTRWTMHLFPTKYIFFYFRNLICIVYRPIGYVFDLTLTLFHFRLHYTTLSWNIICFRSHCRVFHLPVNYLYMYHFIF